MDNITKAQNLISQALQDNFKLVKGIDWSQEDLYKGIDREDLRPHDIDLSGEEYHKAMPIIANKYAEEEYGEELPF